MYRMVSVIPTCVCLDHHEVNTGAGVSVPRTPEAGAPARACLELPVAESVAGAPRRGPTSGPCFLADSPPSYPTLLLHLLGCSCGQDSQEPLNACYASESPLAPVESLLPGRKPGCPWHTTTAWWPVGTCPALGGTWKPLCTFFLLRLQIW